MAGRKKAKGRGRQNQSRNKGHNQVVRQPSKGQSSDQHSDTDSQANAVEKEDVSCESASNGQYEDILPQASGSQEVVNQHQLDVKDDEEQEEESQIEDTSNDCSIDQEDSGAGIPSISAQDVLEQHKPDESYTDDQEQNDIENQDNRSNSLDGQATFNDTSNESSPLKSIVEQQYNQTIIDDQWMEGSLPSLVSDSLFAQIAASSQYKRELEEYSPHRQEIRPIKLQRTEPDCKPDSDDQQESLQHKVNQEKQVDECQDKEECNSKVHIQQDCQQSCSNDVQLYSDEVKLKHEGVGKQVMTVKMLEVHHSGKDELYNDKQDQRFADKQDRHYDAKGDEGAVQNDKEFVTKQNEQVITNQEEQLQVRESEKHDFMQNVQLCTRQKEPVNAKKNEELSAQQIEQPKAKKNKHLNSKQDEHLATRLNKEFIAEQNELLNENLNEELNDEQNEQLATNLNEELVSEQNEWLDDKLIEEADAQETEKSVIKIYEELDNKVKEEHDIKQYEQLNGKQNFEYDFKGKDGLDTRQKDQLDVEEIYTFDIKVNKELGYKQDERLSAKQKEVLDISVNNAEQNKKFDVGYSEGIPMETSEQLCVMQTKELDTDEIKMLGVDQVPKLGVKQNEQTDAKQSKNPVKQIEHLIAKQTEPLDAKANEEICENRKEEHITKHNRQSDARQIAHLHGKQREQCITKYTEYSDDKLDEEVGAKQKEEPYAKLQQNEQLFEKQTYKLDVINVDPDVRQKEELDTKLIEGMSVEVNDAIEYEQFSPEQNEELDVREDKQFIVKENEQVNVQQNEELDFGEYELPSVKQTVQFRVQQYEELEAKKTIQLDGKKSEVLNTKVNDVLVGKQIEQHNEKQKEGDVHQNDKLRIQDMVAKQVEHYTLQQNEEVSVSQGAQHFTKNDEWLRVQENEKYDTGPKQCWGMNIVDKQEEELYEIEDQEFDGKKDHEVNGNQDQEINGKQDLDGEQDQELDGKQDQGLDGKQDQGLDGKQDQELDGKQDQELDKDQELDGKGDQELDGKQDQELDKDQELDGKGDQELDGKQDQELDGKDQELDGKQDQELDGKQDQELDGKDQELDGKQDQELDGKQDQKLDGTQDQELDDKDQELDGTQDQELDGKDQELDGTQDQELDGKDQELDGTQDQELDDKDQELDGKQDQELDGKDQELDGTQDQELDGKQDQELDGKQDQELDGTQDQKLDDKDQELDGKQDQELDGKQDQEFDGKQDQELDGKQDQELDGEQDQELDGEQNQELDGEQEQELDGKKDQELNGKQGQELNGKQDLDGEQDQKLDPQHYPEVDTQLTQKVGADQSKLCCSKRVEVTTFTESEDCNGKLSKVFNTIQNEEYFNGKEAHQLYDGQQIVYIGIEEHGNQQHKDEQKCEPEEKNPQQDPLPDNLLLSITRNHEFQNSSGLNKKHGQEFSKFIEPANAHENQKFDYQSGIESAENNDNKQHSCNSKQTDRLAFSQNKQCDGKQTKATNNKQNNELHESKEAHQLHAGRQDEYSGIDEQQEGKKECEFEGENSQQDHLPNHIQYDIWKNQSFEKISHTDKEQKKGDPSLNDDQQFKDVQQSKVKFVDNCNDKQYNKSRSHKVNDQQSEVKEIDHIYTQEQELQNNLSIDKHQFPAHGQAEKVNKEYEIKPGKQEEKQEVKQDGKEAERKNFNRHGNHQSVSKQDQNFRGNQNNQYRGRQQYYSRKGYQGGYNYTRNHQKGYQHEPQQKWDQNNRGSRNWQNNQRHHQQQQTKSQGISQSGGLICGECEEKYDRRTRMPRNLYCGHTVCTSCARKLLKNSTIFCPQCRTRTLRVTFPDKLPINMPLMAFLSEEANAKPIVTVSNNEEIESQSHSTEVGAIGGQHYHSSLKHTEKSIVTVSNSELMRNHPYCNGNYTRGESHSPSSVRSPHSSRCLEVGIHPTAHCAACDQWVCDVCGRIDHLDRKGCVLIPLKGTLLQMKQDKENMSKAVSESLTRSLKDIRCYSDQLDVLLLSMHAAFECLGKEQECIRRALQEGTEMRKNLEELVSKLPHVKNFPEALACFQTVENNCVATLDWISNESSKAVNNEKVKKTGKELLSITLRSLMTSTAENGVVSQIVACQETPTDKKFSQLTVSCGRMHLHSLSGITTLKEAQALPLECFKACLDSTSTLAFLDLFWDGTSQGRVYIRLIGDTVRGRQFVSLCTGEKGPTFRNTHFHRVWWKGHAGEHVWGGDYDHGDGSGDVALTSICNGEDAEAELGRTVPITPGLVAGRYEKKDVSSIFRIYTREAKHSMEDAAFGHVEYGLPVVEKAIDHNNIQDVIISDCGVVLEM